MTAVRRPRSDAADTSGPRCQPVVGALLVSDASDAMDPHGPTRNFTTSGSANVELLDQLVDTAKQWQLAYVTDTKPEAGYCFRSDHFPFAKRGVPAISFASGSDLVDGGLAAGKAIDDAYTADRYHQPADQWQAEWLFTGMARDLELLYRVGRDLANVDRWPNWGEDSGFRAARDATAAERKSAVIGRDAPARQRRRRPESLAAGGHRPHMPTARLR